MRLMRSPRCHSNSQQRPQALRDKRPAARMPIVACWWLHHAARPAGRRGPPPWAAAVGLACSARAQTWHARMLGAPHMTKCGMPHDQHDLPHDQSLAKHDQLSVIYY